MPSPPPLPLGCKLRVTHPGVLNDLEALSHLLKQPVVARFEHRVQLRKAWCHYSNALQLLQTARVPRRPEIGRAISAFLERVEFLIAGPP
jgi:hypothetical protein